MKFSVFLKYLVASVLSMAAVRLANMADAALVAYVSRFIIYTDMTPEDRREALDILRPYVLKTHRITPYKLVDEGTAKTWYRIINEVILDREDTKDNKVLEDMRSGLEQLHDILAGNNMVMSIV